MDESGFLIIGANGQLGKALQARYPNAQAVDSDQLDITNKDDLLTFDWSKVEVILNAAAYTNVDGAETQAGRVAAWTVNADAVADLVAVAAQKDLLLVHISTDYVFDGSQSPHVEAEPFSPLSAYGASKAAGDIAVSLLPRHYILRTSWVIGEGKNFVRTMLELGKKGVNPTVVADQIGRLTFTSVLVGAIDHLLYQSPGYGTYNVSNDGDPVSWADITRMIFQEAGMSNSVTDTTTAEYYEGKENIAPRPLQSTLDLSKIKATGLEINDWRKDLRAYVQKELAK